MNSPLRVAGVGAGYFSAFHYDAWARMGDVELVAVCDTDRAKAQSTADRHDIRQVYTDAAAMLDEARPDVFDIAVPPAAHLGMISLGAERHISMICQKPFCASLEEARRAVELCETAGVTLAVHENFRFQPWHRKIRSLVDEGAIGPVYQVTFRLRPGDGQGPNAYLDRQPYFQKMQRFLVHETAIHLIDVFRYLFGDVTRIYADLARLNPAIAGEDAGIVLFNFGSGARGLFDGNRLADHAAENRRLTMGEMEVEGEAGTLRLDGDGRISHRAHGDNTWTEIDYDWRNAGFGGDCVFALQRHVTEHLMGRGDLENSARDYLANLEIEDAVYRSNDTAAAIDIPRFASTSGDQRKT